MYKHIILYNVTGPEKTVAIYTKYTCSYYGTYLALWMCYSQSANFIEFPIDFCMHDKICVFYIYIYIYIYMYMYIMFIPISVAGNTIVYEQC